MEELKILLQKILNKDLQQIILSNSVIRNRPRR